MEWMQSANAKLAKTSVSKVERTFCRTEKCDQRGGVKGSLLKLSRSKALAQDPKAHPNHKVLG